MEDLNVPKKIHILLDKACVNRSNIVKNYVEEKNINLLFNVPYSPETNPIEIVFTKVKNIVRNKK